MKDVLDFLEKEIKNSERLMKESEGKGEGHLHSYWMGRTDAFYTLKAMVEVIKMGCYGFYNVKKSRNGG